MHTKCASIHEYAQLTFGSVARLRDGDIKELPRVGGKAVGRTEQSNSTSVTALSADRQRQRHHHQ